MMARFRPVVAIIFALCSIFGGANSAQYLGKFLGKLSELHHGVSGEVYAVDGRTLHIKDFTYDGQGPAAYFYASTTKAANSAGFRLRDETGSGEVIRRYRKEGVTLTLPEGKSLNNIKIFYVWCEEFAVNFGDVKIPRNFDFPRPQKIDPLKGVHDISSDNIVIVDAQTLLIPNLSYDGGAPDAKFWVGRGPKPSPQGIRVPDENGKEIPLRRYDRKTVVLTLPGDLTVFDIGHFGIWCEAFTVDFGHVQIPQNINIPPSLKMLGVSPQSKLNCEVLFDDLAFEVRWAVAGESIVLQLVSKLENREYMSFGVSGDQSKSVMIGGDVVVAWVDKTTLKGYAEDYYLDDKSQCSGPTGSCPDNRLAENTNNIRLLNAAMVNGYSIVTYQRPLKASDEFDKPILTNKTQAVIWAIGPLNQRNEVSFHSQYTKGNKFLDFGRPAKWNCPMPENEQPPMRAVATQSRQKIVQDPPATSTTQATPSRSRNNERRRGGSRRTTEAPVTSDDSERSATRTRQQTERRGGNRGGSRGSSTAVRAVPTPAPVSKRNAWNIPPIQCYEPEDGVFYAQMGPTGGKRGYPAITGHVGWGISWYINGLLIPEINVVRGKTYTFVVEGGFDPEVPAKYHPFYITDDSVGGYEYKTPEEKKNIKIFAGVRKGKDGSVVPVGTGRLCHWTQQGDLDADDFESFGAYQRTLELKCDQGEPGVIQWTPDRNTPNTVYYQCFTHRYLGWKINVLDSCDEQPASSELDSVIVPAPSDKSDLEESPSVRIETMVKPNNINNEDKEDNKASKSTVSERKTNPNLDPSQLDGQPEIPKEPILFHQPQQSLYNTFYGPQFAQNTYNPYAFENPFDHHYYEHTFKPSTALSYVNEDTTLIVPTSTTTSSTTARTTTAKPISSSAAPKLHEKFVGAAAENLPSNHHFLPPVVKAPPKFNKMTIRRPLGPGFANRPPPFHFQIKAPMRQPPPLRPFPPQMFKKPIYRPMKQRPFFKIENNPMFFSGSQPKRPPITPPNFLVLKPQIIPSPPPIKPTELIQTPEVKHVEISPQQASTEREPEIQTAASAIVSSVAPPLNQYQMIRMRPAYNTGFKPETVVIEGGFKPIMSREFRERIDDDEPELEYESEIGVINIDSGKKLEKKAVPEHFEPIFIPSPTDKPLKQKYVKVFKRPLKKSNLRIIFKEPRSLEESADLEPVAEAAERVDTYYLPPLDKTKAPIEFPQQRSNIDIEAPTNLNIDSPPDVVVTYDGKKVSGASLTARLADRSSVLDMRGSKAAEFIKARPQSVPYKGELPQFIPEFLKNAPQLQSRGVLHRDLNTPSLPVRSGITKLTRVDNLKVASRRKRFAHHTPEHTAEQERQRSNSSSTQKNSSSNLFISVYAQYSLMMVALCLIKYL